MQIRDYPVGLLRWGMGSLAQRSLSDILSDFFNELPSLESDPAVTIDVAALAKGLLDFIKPEFDTTEEARESGIAIGGYTSGAHFPELYLLELKKDWPDEVASSAPTVLLPDYDGNLKQFGVALYGQTNPLERLLNGVDEHLLEHLEQWWDKRTIDIYDADQIDKPSGFPKHEIEGLLRQFPYELTCDQMHVQDAIDFAIYLVNVVNGLNRFWRYAPMCGGDIDVAVIQRTGFKSFRRKTWS